MTFGFRGVVLFGESISCGLKEVLDLRLDPGSTDSGVFDNGAAVL